MDSQNTAGTMPSQPIPDSMKAAGVFPPSTPRSISPNRHARRAAERALKKRNAKAKMNGAGVRLKVQKRAEKRALRARLDIKDKPAPVSDAQMAEMLANAR